MGSEQINDEQLVKRYAAGDAAAFTTLVRRYQNPVYRLASIWLYDPQNANDVAQEVFLRSVKGLQGFRFRANVYTWLYRLTRNVCHEFNRKKPAEPLDCELPDDNHEPDDILHQQDTINSVRRAIQQLPPRQRDVVLLRIFEDLSVRDTAIIMNCRQGTVKALMHKAKARLQLNWEYE